MSRKVFLSFLGTNRYIPCNYFEEGNPEFGLKNVKFIQEALIKMYCNNFSDDDQILMFLTNDANERNYKNNGLWNPGTKRYNLENIGLESTLENVLPQVGNPNLKPVPIKDGFSSEDIWSIFETVSDEVKENDEVTIDITHAFRFLPMLGVVLMNYLKATKNIKVKGIYYGAFEKLGPAPKVELIPLDERNAPILNLKTLLEFQDWTAATNEFLRFGEVGSLVALSSPKIGKQVNASQGSNEIAKKLNRVTKKLKYLIDNIKANRLKEVFHADFQSFDEEVAELEHVNFDIKPFNQIIGLIRNKTRKLNIGENKRWLASSNWCLEHGLLLQSYSQLQEGFLSYLMLMQNGLMPNIPLDIYLLDDRMFYSSISKIHVENKSKEEWKFPKGNPKYLELADEIFKPGIIHFDSHFKLYQEISDFRNDVLHGGMRSNAASAHKISAKIDDFLRRTESLMINMDDKDGNSDFKASNLLFLNLSNHPSYAWPAKQIQEAESKYGSIEDMPFPQIDPEGDEMVIKELAEQYLSKILEIRPKAVHLMGELTFSFELARMLQSHGINCLASTTHRTTQDLPDGTKVSRFEFVRFRHY